MPWWRWNVSTTCSASPSRISPVSTNTHVSCVADRLVDEGGGHRRVDAAGQPADDPVAEPTWARTSSTAVSMIEVIVHVGLQPQTSYRNRLSISCPSGVCDTSGWNWTPNMPAAGVLERGRRALGRAGGDGEARRGRGDRVEVAHPHRLRRPAGRGRARRRRPSRASSVRPYSPRPVRRHLAAELAGDELGAVADAEDGDAEVVDGRIEPGSAVDVDRLGPAREDEPGRAGGRRSRRR